MSVLRNLTKTAWGYLGHIYIVPLLAVLVVAIYAFSTPNLQVTTGLSVVAPTPSSIPTPPTSPTPEPTQVLVRERDMGSWQYRVVRYGDDYDALITYDDSSVASLQAYAAANRELAWGWWMPQNRLMLSSPSTNTYNSTSIVPG